jgi:hypothetical protein
MATANSIGVRTSADHQARIAAVSKLSATDRAAESWLSTAGREALHRATTATAKIRDDEFTAALNARGLNEYNDYVTASAAA